MGSLNSMVYGYGTRVGFWRPNAGHHTRAFDCKGFFIGKSLGDIIPGTDLEQNLNDKIGNIEFRCGVLFRPDLGKRKRLEPIFVITGQYKPEMFDFKDWTQDYFEVECSG